MPAHNLPDITDMAVDLAIANHRKSVFTQNFTLSETQFKT
jgi:hypothetical protein